MERAEIPGRSRNIWSNQKYLEEVGIHGGNRNTGKKQEYMEGAEIPGRSRNIWSKQKYRGEVRI
jgi:hypothetical protein